MHSEEERQHRIVRRGITYGDREDHPAEDPILEQMPTRGVGLLFMCFQGDIQNQFEYIQRVANDPREGLDPLIAQPEDPGQAGSQTWPVTWGGDPDQLRPSFDFHGFVKLKGGEYFFAPSLSFLQKLG